MFNQSLWPSVLFQKSSYLVRLVRGIRLTETRLPLPLTLLDAGCNDVCAVLGVSICYCVHLLSRGEE